MNLFGKYLELGVSFDNSNAPLEYRSKGLEIGLKEMSKYGIVAFQGDVTKNCFCLSIEDAIVRPGLLEAYMKYYSEAKVIPAKASLSLW
jgi:hypothetical protein